MCPPLSCCHRRHAGPLPTLLYYLQRLLLASLGDEALTDTQRRRLPARLQALWHQSLSNTYLRPSHCPILLELLLPELLAYPCCCQAVRERVPLTEALHRGFRSPRRWARRATIRLRVTTGKTRHAPH